MEVLEIKPVRYKEIKAYVVNLSNVKPNLNRELNFIEILSHKNLNFVTIDLENENLRSFAKSPLAKILEKNKIPYYTVDIPEYVMGYLMTEILEKEDQVNELIKEFLIMKNKSSIKALNLKSWIDFLKEEIEEKKLLIQLKLRPEWIVKKILDIIRLRNDNEIKFVHFAQDKVINETINLLKDLNIKIKLYEKKEENFSLNLIISEEEIKQWKY
ncbi:MAG: hypothetical protein ACFFBE_04540 [Promethearchaeota archaeon]